MVTGPDRSGESQEAEDLHWWHQGRRRIVASVLRRHLPPDTGRRIFAAGVGTAAMTELLGEFGSVSVGGIPDGLPPAGEVDLIALLDVLAHLADDRAALVAAHRALSPGGTLVVTVPAFEFLWGPRDQAQGLRRRYGRDEVRERLESTGFTVDAVSYFDAVLFPFAAAASIVRRIRGWDELPRYEVRTPGPLTNRLLGGVLASEGALIGRWSPPAGDSVLAIARRP